MQRDLCVRNPRFSDRGFVICVCARLLAPTWANRAVQHGVFLTCSGIKKRPLSWKCKSIIPREGAFVDRFAMIFRKIWYYLRIDEGLFWQIGIDMKGYFIVWRTIDCNLFHNQLP